MARIGLAFRMFFKVLGDGAFAERARALVEGREFPGPVVAPMRQSPQVTPAPRADARGGAGGGGGVGVCGEGCADQQASSRGL